MATDSLNVWKNYDFTLTGANTDAQISPTIDAASRFEVAELFVTEDSANTDAGGRAVRIGFGAATLTATGAAGTPISAAGNGILFNHLGIAAGSGGPGCAGMGLPNEELRVTNEAPGGGNITVYYRGRVIPA